MQSKKSRTQSRYEFHTKEPAHAVQENSRKEEQIQSYKEGEQIMHAGALRRCTATAHHNMARTSTDTNAKITSHRPRSQTADNSNARSDSLFSFLRSPTDELH